MASTITLPGTKRIGPLTMPRDLVDQLDAIAPAQNVDRDVLVLTLVEAGLEGCAHSASRGAGTAPRARVRTRKGADDAS